jgi:glycosyltransferase involved in cell wall biosynthesis
MADRSTAIGTFAVVIPLYNHERYIGAAIESVLRQTRPVDEIILIDDGSVDAGFQIASDRLRGHTHTKLDRQVNAGAHVAINRAIESSNCEYVAILNSDDIFFPEKIAQSEAIFRAQNNIDLLIGGVEIIDESGLTVSSGSTIDWLDRAHRFFSLTGLIGLSLLHENFAVTTSNMVFRKELWRRNGGFQALRYCHDLDFLMTSLLNGHIHYDSARYISYRVHKTNTIKDSLAKIRVEIAAVLANAFRECGHALTGGVNAGKTIAALYELIKTKDVSSLALILSAVRSSYADRGAFYRAVISEEQYRAYEMVLEGVPTSQIAMAYEPPMQLHNPSGDDIPSIRSADARGIRKKSPLTVAIEVGSFDKGGLEKVVLDSAISFKQHGIQPIIVSAGPVGHLATVAASHGVEVLQLPIAGRDIFYSALLRVREVKLTMSHFSRVGYKIFRKLGIPNITFIHNVYAMLAGDALSNFKADDHLVGMYISVSPKATRYASNKLGVDAAKIVTIPNGLILNEHQDRASLATPADRGRFGLKPSDYVFLNVASYNLHKGHYLMAQAMDIVRTQRSDIKLVCIGNEIYPPHVQQLRDHLKSRGLESSMSLPGFYADVSPFFKMADAFVLPSFIEGWSIAMNEAMFYKKPMILSDTGGASEVIENEDIGILLDNEYGDVINLDAQMLDELAYSPRDYLTAPGLANAMLRFAIDPVKWAAAGRLGHSKVVNRYNFSDVVARYIDIIHQCIGTESVMPTGRLA